jgi:ketosteroid isomerase-like protein
MNRFTIHTHRRARRLPTILSLFIALLLATAPLSASQQKNKKNKKDDLSSNDNKLVIPMADEQQIDYMISTMLAAWQLNDVDRMHTCYADDVTFVSGIWAPPVIGWASYVPLYQAQRARAQQVRLERTNTLIKVDGVVAWASYQWDFSGTVDGRPMVAQGQTTLIMEKRNNRWLIVHNHTSVAQTPQLPAAAPTTGGQPAAQALPSKPPSR